MASVVASARCYPVGRVRGDVRPRSGRIVPGRGPAQDARTMTATTGRRLHSTQTHTLPVPRCPEGNARAANKPAAEPRAAAVIAFSVPCWRAVLETRWTYWMSQVTELSLAFHAAAGRIGCTFIGSEPELERLQRQIAVARRALVEHRPRGRPAVDGPLRLLRAVRRRHSWWPGSPPSLRPVTARAAPQDAMTNLG